MGFPNVYDYAAGKKSWGSFGLPREGTKVPELMAGDVASSDVPTCTLADPLVDVRARVLSAGWETCIVVNEHRVVLGRLGRRAIVGDSDASVEEAMTPGPSTVRPSIGAEDLLERMLARHVTSFLVTTPDGRLVGLALLRDLE